MRTTRPFRRTRLIRLAAGLLVAALLVATGWAAEKLYQFVADSFVILEEETLLEERSGPVKLPDGAFRSASRTVRISVGAFLPEDASPGAVEKAMQGLEEVKQLIGQKKYEFIKTYTGPSGEEEYVYRFTLADGRQVAMNFSIPLENVASWDDYLQKISEQAKQRQE